MGVDSGNHPFALGLSPGWLLEHPRTFQTTLQHSRALQPTAVKSTGSNTVSSPRQPIQCILTLACAARGKIMRRGAKFDSKTVLGRDALRKSHPARYSGVTLNVARPDMNNYATLGVMLY